MMTVLVCAVALIGQSHKAEKPMVLDPIKQRQVFEAWVTANTWAKDQAEHLYPGLKAGRLQRPQRAKFEQQRRVARRYLTDAAAKQVCEAYDIDRKTMINVVQDRRSRDQKFVPEALGEGVHMANGFRSITHPTRFDPSKIILPDKIAAQIGYKNPSADGPRQPYMSSAYMPDGRRIPGAPDNPEEEKRLLEIRKRAREAKIKDPVPQ